jgi:hypothetical protein
VDTIRKSAKMGLQLQEGRISVADADFDVLVL